MAVTSANAAKLFNIYPRKGFVGVGADADLVVWDPEASKTISAKTHHSKGDFNVFEGRTVRGVPSHTISQGRVVYVQGQLQAEQGVGRYIKRPAFGANFQAAGLRASTQAPSPVLRQEVSEAL